MFKYQKKEMFPVKVKGKNVKLAKYIHSQLGGPYGELAASITYLSQRYTMPDERGRNLLSDIGCEELSHVEMISTLIYELTKGATPEEMEENGLGCDYVVHGKGIAPVSCNGVDFCSSGIGVSGDPIVDLQNDMAAEEKARSVYEHILDICQDEEVRNVILFLRQREVVHFNRFKDLLEIYKKECGK